MTVTSFKERKILNLGFPEVCEQRQKNVSTTAFVKWQTSDCQALAPPGEMERTLRDFA